MGYQNDQDPLWLYYARQEVDVALRKNSEVVQLPCHTKADCFGLKRKHFPDARGHTDLLQ